jgi:hypothetical protein
MEENMNPTEGTEETTAPESEEAAAPEATDESAE